MDVTRLRGHEVGDVTCAPLSCALEPRVLAAIMALKQELPHLQMNQVGEVLAFELVLLSLKVTSAPAWLNDLEQIKSALWTSVSSSVSGGLSGE